MLALLAGCATLALATVPSLAAVTATGDVDPADPLTWTTGTTAYIGRTGEGSIAVEGGSGILSRTAFLGLDSGSHGVVTVDGSGSTWINDRNLTIGWGGHGTLSISGGALVNSDRSWVGYSHTSAGAVIVDGPGSTWSNSGRLDVGRLGVGTVDISNGGIVSTYDGYIGSDQWTGFAGTGEVTIDGPGSTWTSSQNLYVGFQANGTLTIQNGGLASIDYRVLIGSVSGSTGTVIVDGPESILSSGNRIVVGGSGNSNLSIINGGSVLAREGWIGGSHDSVAILTVDGSGSTWTGSGSLAVGVGSQGRLSIANRGAVVVGTETYVAPEPGSTATIDFNDGVLTTRSLYSAPTRLTGTGTINVKGLVSDVDLVFNADHSTQQSFVINDQVTVNLDIDGTGNLGAGYRGSGSIVIADGVSVSSARSYLAYDVGSSGTTTVIGAGSTWMTGEHLFVGREGEGTLLITNQGAVSSHIAYLGGIERVGENFARESRGTVTVDGLGSTWTASGRVYIGNQGVGTLSITNGGAVMGTETYIGHWSNSSGSINTITVEGEGSIWTNSGDIYVGRRGGGNLEVLNGGVVDNADAYVGFLGRPASATVDGPDSVWTSTGALYVGWDTIGSLSIVNGGTVNSEFGVIALRNNSHGSTVTVDGVGSTWTISDGLSVATDGDGTLWITNGGIVNAAQSFIGAGWHWPGTGHVIVDGMGSRLNNTDALYVGSDGLGNLVVRNEGRLSSKEAYIGRGGSGTLWITDGGSVSTATSDIGLGSSGSGVVKVDGHGSTWTLGGMLQMGRLGGEGELSIRDGGMVINTEARLGIASGSSGTIEVDGVGSTWTNSGRLFLGMSGEASLSITEGGMVSNTLGFVGNGTGSSGVVNVDGFGSIWLSSLDLHVGRDGDGILTITNRGLVQVDGRLHIDPLGRGGTDYIAMDTGGMLKLFGNGAEDIDAFLGLVQGSDDIRYWTGSEWDNILNATPGIHYTLSFDGSHTTLTVPEPASVVLLGVGGLALIRRKRHAA